MNVLDMLRAELGEEHIDHDRIREVAAKTGVSYYTLRKLAKGYTNAPSFATAEALRRYYSRQQLPRRSASRSR